VRGGDVWESEKERDSEIEEGRMLARE